MKEGIPELGNIDGNFCLLGQILKKIYQIVKTQRFDLSIMVSITPDQGNCWTMRLSGELYNIPTNSKERESAPDWN